jgi:hypothetical protein
MPGRLNYLCPIRLGKKKLGNEQGEKKTLVNELVGKAD